MDKGLVASISVILVEDHMEYRETLELAFAKTADINLVGAFGAAEVALRHLQMGEMNPKPDVILLDIGLPGISGHEAITEFLEFSGARIIMLTQSDREADVFKSISLGAVGYLVKGATVNQILNGIRSAVSGDSPLDSRVAKYFLSTFKSSSSKGRAHESVLTKRELEILHLLADGMTKREIAQRLGLSGSTISTHVVHIFEKLRVQNAPAAVARAFRIGILSPDSK